jgi:adenylate kinase
VYLILLGAPGTGKGTQAVILANRYGWLHVSTGDMLRDAVAKSTELGKSAKGYMDAGALVPDELVIKMLVDRISQPDAAAGFVLDGFPRNLPQGLALDEALKAEGKALDRVLNIDVPDEELVRRLGGRWLCRDCGAIYQETTNPPRMPGKCDKCGGELCQRDDDKPETVRARLDKQKPPADLVDHYRKQGLLVEIDGTQAIDGVTEAMVDAIGDSKAVSR